MPTALAVAGPAPAMENDPPVLAPVTSITQPIWTAWNGVLTSSNTLTTQPVNLWPAWNQQWTVTFQTAATTNTWTAWNQNAPYIVTTLTDNAWLTWNEQAREWARVPVETPEEQAERQRQNEIRARQARLDALQREKDRKAAARRARNLLRSALSREQRKELDEYGRFDLILPNGNRYRIHRGTHGNVRLLDKEGKEYKAFCIQPSNVPDEDAMMAQMLMLQADEAAFLRIANARGVGAGFYREGRVIA